MSEELRDILTRCAVNGMHLQRVNKEFIESEVKQLSTLISHERAEAVKNYHKHITTSYGEFKETSAEDSSKTLEEYLSNERGK